MKAGKAIALFILGIIFALLTFPIAWSVSIALGYVFAIIAIVTGAYLIAKREGRKLPLVLGIILLLIAIPTFLGTAFIHVGLWVVKEAIEEVTETETATARVGETIKAGNWEVIVLEIKETEYIKKGDSYYKAENESKLILVRMMIKNVGDKAETASDIWNFILVSNANKSYEKTYTYELDWIPSRDITDKIKSKAVIYEELDTFASVAPNTYIEGDLLFQIPADEEPSKLHFKVGIIGGLEVTVELKK